jgi:hypothetical protein
MKEKIKEHFKNFDFDIRKSKDARFMDQKVTPDVLCIMADCILNHVADRNIEFTKDDIWSDQYFIKNVKDIFKKPDAKNETTRLEYDKFTSQPLRMLAYTEVLTMRKKNGKNWYKIANKEILEFIAWKERTAYIFLYVYLLKVLGDSDLLKYFEEFKEKCENKTVNSNDFQDLKNRYSKFIRGNTKINTKIEVNRIFPKVLNIYSCENNIRGTIKGHLSRNQIYFTDLMYNRTNWRDIKKDKHISRQESILEYESLTAKQNPTYSKYQVQKAMNMIRKMYKESEVKDQWAKGEATQVHHIFPQATFPELAAYLENLIKLTPTQHFTKAHPSNQTQEINKDYQLVCLLAKTDSIEKSLNQGQVIYRKEFFIFVVNRGLSIKLDYDLEFTNIKSELVRFYNKV